jgi:hypothetical protein
VEDDDEKVGVAAFEEWHVHWELQLREQRSEREGGEGDLVGFVESDSEVPLSGELEEGESAEVEQAQVRGFLPPLQHEVADRDEQLCHIATPAPGQREGQRERERDRGQREGQR